jgi:hypothetical protein
MLPYGTLYDNLEDQNLSFHKPAYLATNTGRVYGGCFPNFKETIFAEFGEKYDVPPEKVWLLGHYLVRDAFYPKNDDRKYPSYFSAFGWGSIILDEILTKREKKFIHDFRVVTARIKPPWPLWDSFDPVLFSILKKILRVYKPKLVHYVMSNTEAAHYGMYVRYVHGLKMADDSIYDLWNTINTDPYYKNNTYLIVQVDHGRDNYYMQHDYAKEKVWMYIYGPCIKKNNIIKRCVHHTDVYATLRYLLGMQHNDNSQGRILKDCFVEAPYKPSIR